MSQEKSEQRRRYIGGLELAKIDAALRALNALKAGLTGKATAAEVNQEIKEAAALNDRAKTEGEQLSPTSPSEN